VNRALQRIHDIGAMAWLKFLRALNALVAVLLPTVLLVHQAYPSVITGLVAKMPPLVGIAAIAAFCLVVHYALRRSIKAV
jgi:hypothetical protein